MNSGVQVQRLGRIANTIGGTGFPHDYQGNDSGDLPFVKVSDLKLEDNRAGIRHAVNYISHETRRKLGARTIPIGSIVFPKVGAALLGNARALTATECVIDNNLMAVTPRKGDPRFWMYALLTIDLGEIAGSGPLPFVSESQVRDLQVPCPPPEEQRRIADFLDAEVSRIKQIYDLRSREISLLEEWLAVFERQAIGGFSGDADVESGVPWIGKVHPSCEVVPLGRIVTLQRGVDLTHNERRDGSVPVVTTAGIVGSHDRALVRGPAVVVGRYGSAGSVHWIEASCWPHNTTLYVKNFHGNLPRYCYYVLRSVPYEMEQARSAVPGINRNDLHRRLMPRLSLEMQQMACARIDEAAAHAAETIAAIRSSLVLLAERRHALISAAITGQFDVITGRGVDLA